MPRGRRARSLLTGPEKRAIAARLAAGGEALVAALDALDGVAGRVREASVLDKAAHADWQEALRTAARAASKRHGSRSRRRSPTSSAAGQTRSTRSPAGGRRSGRCWRCGRRSPWRWCGSDWCWAATSRPPRGSRRASASERRAVTAIGVGVDLVEVYRVWPRSSPTRDRACSSACSRRPSGLLRESPGPRDSRGGSTRRQGGGLQSAAGERRGSGDWLAGDRGDPRAGRPAGCSIERACSGPGQAAGGWSGCCCRCRTPIKPPWLWSYCLEFPTILL